MRQCPKCGKLHANDVSYCSLDGTRLTGVDSVSDGSQSAELEAGTVLGSYRLLQLLGEGGMGRVYIAEHTRLGRRVAIKTLRSEFADKPGAVKRFFQEARAVNQIKNDNIVDITDFIEEEGGENYYIMELLEGRSLRDVILQEGALPVPRTLGIAVQVADALAAVHDAGVVHRDLKTENIFLIERGGQRDFVKLLDFGVAKLVEQPDGQSLHKTAEGAILGTPEYMSPEQASGGKVDYRTDIYAFGIILYEMLTGAKPFTAKSFGELVIKHLTVKPVKPSKLKDRALRLPRALENLILHCLEKDAQKRPQSMAEIGQQLRSIGRAESVQLESFVEPTAPVRRPRRRLAALVVIGLLLVAGAIGIGLQLHSTDATVAPDVDPAGTVVSEPEPESPAVEPAEQDPPPLEPPQVELAFDSQPSGAEVRKPGANEPLGVTPFEISLERSSREVVFEFQLDGYRGERRQISLAEDALVEATLEKRRARRRRKAQPGKARRRRWAGKKARAGRAAQAGPQAAKTKVGSKKAAGRKLADKPKRDEKDEEKPPAEGKSPELDLRGVVDPFAE